MLVFALVILFGVVFATLSIAQMRKGRHRTLLSIISVLVAMRQVKASVSCDVARLVAHHMLTACLGHITKLKVCLERGWHYS